MKELSLKELMAKKRERLNAIEKSYRDSINFVLNYNKKVCESKTRNHEEHNKMLVEYRNAQEMAWLYPKVVMGWEK